MKGKHGFTTVSTRASDDGHGVLLDDQPLRTPLGTPIVVPNGAMAEAIAAEWRAAGPRPRPDAIPVTRMAGTALDWVAAKRSEMEQQLLAHAETELLCYRATEPPDLVAREHEAWQPLLDWLAQRHDALMTVFSGVMSQPQNPAALAALRSVLAGLDPWRVAGLSLAVGASGSLVLGLAMLDKRLDARSVFDLAELDASYQIEKWGSDAEATARRNGVRAELDLAQRFLSLLD